jgi:hypothetical protein
MSKDDRGMSKELPSTHEDENDARAAGRQWGLNMGAVAAQQILEAPRGTQRQAMRAATELLMKQGIIRIAARLECKHPDYTEAWIDAAEKAMRESMAEYAKRLRYRPKRKH